MKQYKIQNRSQKNSQSCVSLRGGVADLCELPNGLLCTAETNTIVTKKQKQ
jgi:hypothetical protein